METSVISLKLLTQRAEWSKFTFQHFGEKLTKEEETAITS